MPKLVNGKQVKRPKPPQRFCSYCNKERAVTNFPEGSDICKFCVVFDKAAQLTAPIADPLQAEKYPITIFEALTTVPQNLGNQ